LNSTQKKTSFRKKNLEVFSTATACKLRIAMKGTHGGRFFENTPARTVFQQSFQCDKTKCGPRGIQKVNSVLQRRLALASIYCSVPEPNSQKKTKQKNTQKKKKHLSMFRRSL